MAVTVSTARSERPPRVRGHPGLAMLFLLPALLLLGALVVYPIVFSVIRSLFDASGSNFVGVHNYEHMFTDPSTQTAIKNNIIWVVVAPTVVTALGLLFAVLTERIRWGTLFKLLIFMPMAISFLAAGIIFRLVYDESPDKGVANAIVVGLHDVFLPSSQYPDARPRNPAQMGPVKGGGFTSKSTYAVGGAPVRIGLVGYPPQSVPAAAVQATAPSSGPGLRGTVWLDFALGGGGKDNVIDHGEKGLPGITVEAVQGGNVVAKAKTAANGTFSFPDLTHGSYAVTLPADNFRQPFNGVTWLGPSLVTPAIIAAFVWMYAGFAMVLIAAGLSAIPRDALEAARVDGATEWQVFRRVTMPLLMPVLVVVFVTLVINVMKIFDLVYIIAPGSVQPDANVLALQMWLVSFGGGNDFGLGSAIGVFLFLLVVPAMAFNIRRFRLERR
jgi:ABC-type sugar transport system permease subunit